MSDLDRLVEALNERAARYEPLKTGALLRSAAATITRLREALEWLAQNALNRADADFARQALGGEHG